MNNEPVAWMSLFMTKSELGNIQIPDLHLTKPPSHLYDEVIPLYTNPIKELTDEEIKQVWHDYQGTLIDFAKAILRKAQEK